MNKFSVAFENEWFFPSDRKSIRKKSAENSLFYVVLLQKGRQRYLKIGTTEKTISQRFSSKDYKAYSTIKFLYVAEISSPVKPEYACYHLEDLTRSKLRETKGFTFVKNDRFQFFQLPATLPIVFGFGEQDMKEIPVKAVA